MFEFLNYILTANVEIVCLLTLGTLFQMTDGTPFQIKKKWDAVWSTDLPREYFSPIMQQILKTGLSVIVAARCGATYPYIATAMLLIFSLLKDRAPKLMLPWMFVAAVKSIGMTFLEALIGVYVCSAFGKIQKACIEFLISKALEIIFAAYLWGSVLSVYHDMERRLDNERILQNPEIAFIKSMDLKRKRARSLLDETTLYKTACLNHFEFKDVPRIILQMLRRANEMSQDSLLGPGMMLASVSSMGSFDNLKKSESLGELGYTNLQSTKVIGLDDEENLSPAEKALKFLKLSWSDIRRAQQSETCAEKDICSINSDTWLRVTISDARIYKPRQTRTEIYIRELPEMDFGDDNLFNGQNFKRIYNIKLGVSLFNLLKKNNNDADADGDDDEDELFVDSQEETEEEKEEPEEEKEEEEDDEETSKIFMSNIKDEEKPVNRIGLNISGSNYRGRAYYKLYKKDFMSVIGPEVFERATKLRKVTSLAFTKPNAEESLLGVNSSTTSQSETSGGNMNGLPDEGPSTAREIQQKSVNFLTGNRRKEVGNCVTPSENGCSVGVNQNRNFRQMTIADDQELKEQIFKKQGFTTEGKLIMQKSECASQKSGEEEYSPPLNTLHPNEESVKVKKIRPPLYRKRRVRIKWIGKLKERKFIDCVSKSSSFSNDLDDSSDFQPKPETNFDEDNTKSLGNMRVQPSYSSILHKQFNSRDDESTENGEMYFLMELLHKPLPEILRRYYDMKNVMYRRRKLNAIYQNQFEISNDFYKINFWKRLEETNEFGGKNYKVWKSNVLKIAEANQQPITDDFANKIGKDVINKLLRYQSLFLISKLKENDSNVSTTSFLKIDAEDGKNSMEQSSMKLTSSKSRNELCCTSHSGNVFRSREILNEGNDIIYRNKRNFSETPSEHSIEVCRKDLINGQIYDSEPAQSPLDSCSKCECKISEDAEEFKNAEDVSIYSQESDEPISLYYSKAANLASPLLDMKKFIYPDHIHYSYKHVNKKGFDVNISGDLPLLVQSQALAKENIKEMPAKRKPEISKRPMDLSFTKTNAFAEWQHSEQNVSDLSAQSSENSKKTKTTPMNEEANIRKKGKSSKKKSRDSEANSSDGKSSDSHHVYFPQNDAIREKMSNESNEKAHRRLTYHEERTPVQISSTQLHSNKGRLSSTYNPALRLQENKKEEKKKAEAKEQRTKEMFARLEKESLFQNKNGFNSSKR